MDRTRSSARTDLCGGWQVTAIPTATDRAGERADGCASLATCQGRADATCNTAHGTDGGADFHGVMEGRDFGGVTARAVQ